MGSAKMVKTAMNAMWWPIPINKSKTSLLT